MHLYLRQQTSTTNLLFSCPLVSDAPLTGGERSAGNENARGTRLQEQPLRQQLGQEQSCLQWWWDPVLKHCYLKFGQTPSNSNGGDTNSNKLTQTPPTKVRRDLANQCVILFTYIYTLTMAVKQVTTLCIPNKKWFYWKGAFWIHIFGCI